MAMESYRAVKSGKIDTIQREIDRLQRFSESKHFMMFMEEFGYRDKDNFMMAREFPHMLTNSLNLELDEKKRSHSRKKVLEIPREVSSDDEP